MLRTTRCHLINVDRAGSCRPDHERGSTLIGVLLLLVLLSVLVGAAMMSLESLERARGSRSQIDQLDAAARGAIEFMTERLRSRASLRLGAIDAADVAALNGDIGSLPTAAGTSIDPTETGYRVVAVREQDPIPEDAEILNLWTDQPRLRYSSTPRPQGQVAGRTIEVEMRVRVTGTAETRRTLTRTVALSRVSPYPYVLYTHGTEAEFCSFTGGATISGAVRVDGLAYFPACAAGVTLIGTLDGRDGVRNDNPRNRILAEDGWLPLETWSRAAAETGGTTLLGTTAGHVRIPPAWGGTYQNGRRQDAALAGTGECTDRLLACGANSYFAPGVTLQRTIIGASASVTISCGQAYNFSASGATRGRQRLLMPATDARNARIVACRFSRSTRSRSSCGIFARAAAAASSPAIRSNTARISGRWA